MSGTTANEAQEEPVVRHREYEWSDPAGIAAAAPEVSGLEFLQRMASGSDPQPPITATLNFRLSKVEPGKVTVLATAGEFTSNAIGTTHGGVIATWADTAMGYAIQSRLPAGSSLTTLDIQVRYLRPVPLDGATVTIVGEAEHVGRRTAVSTARVMDGSGRTIATASCTCLILEARAR
jgi:uncharacterized protein (TIGR00369 family)